MDRLEFLRQARQLAYEQVESSSCENDAEWEIHKKALSKNKELALYEKAKEILENTVFDIDAMIEDLKSE